MTEGPPETDAPHEAAPNPASPSATTSPAAPPMSRAERIFVRINILQAVLAIAGLFTGAVALYAALSEADAVRKQQQAAVWPHIRVVDLNVGRPGEERFDVIVGNRGIGPARIKSATLTVDGKRVKSWYEVIDTLADGAAYGISNYPIAGEVLAPGEDIVTVSVEAKYASVEIVKAFQDLVRAGRGNLQICYCSVFDECWRSDALSRKTTPVDACPEQAAGDSI
ncbi:MAG: hypothetical protein KDA46_15270 [Parvularculaceae bacterium]|nr:hypothetical protein [Parvularculaceae bacterium]